MCRKGACVVTTQTKARPDYNKETGLLRGLPKWSSFSREYTEYAGGRGGGGQWSHLKMLIMIMHSGSLKIKILKVGAYSFGREAGGHKKRVPAVYAFDNGDNFG